MLDKRVLTPFSFEKETTMNATTETKTQSKVEAAVAVKVGLCVNCNHASSCGFLAVGGPVWYCEEHDGEQAVAARPVAAPQAHVETITRGICANCEDGKSCSLPAAAAGALYCEEYR
jgi:hypothetical protein